MADAHIKKEGCYRPAQADFIQFKKEEKRSMVGNWKYYYKMKEGKINGANSICSVGQTACQTITGKSLLE